MDPHVRAAATALASAADVSLPDTYTPVPVAEDALGKMFADHPTHTWTPADLAWVRETSACHTLPASTAAAAGLRRYRSREVAEKDAAAAESLHAFRQALIADVVRQTELHLQAIYTTPLSEYVLTYMPNTESLTEKHVLQLMQAARMARVAASTIDAHTETLKLADRFESMLFMYVVPAGNGRAGDCYPLLPDALADEGLSDDAVADLLLRTECTHLRALVSDGAWGVRWRLAALAAGAQELMPVFADLFDRAIGKAEPFTPERREDVYGPARPDFTEDMMIWAPYALFEGARIRVRNSAAKAVEMVVFGDVPESVRGTKSWRKGFSYGRHARCPFPRREICDAVREELGLFGTELGEFIEERFPGVRVARRADGTRVCEWRPDPVWPREAALAMVACASEHGLAALAADMSAVMEELAAANIPTPLANTLLAQQDVLVSRLGARLAAMEAPAESAATPSS